MRDTPARAGDGHAPLIWRSPPLRLAAAAIPLWMTMYLLAANVGALLKLVVAAVFAVSVVAPPSGLIVCALLAPLGQLLAPLVGYPDFRVGEAIIVAFLGGWLLRGLPDRRGPRVPAAWAGALLAAAIVASVAGVAWQLRAYPAVFAATVDQLQHIYYFIIDRTGFVEGARLIEGIALAAATVVLFRRRPSIAVTLPLALASSAAIAALSSVLLWRGIGTAAALARYKMIGYRVSGHVGDVNAAGSYFALTLCLGLGMTCYRRGLERAIWIGLAAASGAGLWLSGSRSALGAAGAVVVLAGAWAVTARFSSRARAIALLAVVLALIAGAAVRARILEADPDYRGANFREQFVQTSLRMIAARPLAGVGVGQYNRVSALFLSPQLAWTYGFENAHNFFLQVAGELGLLGVGLFLAWIGVPLARAGRAMARTPRDWRLAGAAGGALAFLITCLTGHPLLVPEIAYPFWMQFGLAAALAGSTLLNTDRAEVIEARAARAASAPGWALAAAGAVICIAIGSPALGVAAPVRPSDSQAVNGLYAEETLEDGTRFRWSGAYASLFVPADVTRVEIPVRLPTDGRSIRPMGVEAEASGVDLGRTIVDARWAILSLRLPEAPPPSRFKRIDLKVDRVWTPALLIAGSADMRVVGVQVGEPRLFRD